MGDTGGTKDIERVYSMIRLFVSDLDNTLLNHEKRVTEADQAALRTLEREGVILCLASGRMDKELTRIAGEIGINAHRISQNGAFLYTKENEKLSSAVFPGELARQLYQEALPFGLSCFINQENDMLVKAKTPEIRAIEQRMKMPVKEDPHVPEQIGHSILPSKLCFFGDLETIKKLEQHINTKYRGQLDTFISDKDCIDFMPYGISKGAAIEKLIDRLGLKAEEVACIGDSFNDISMLRMTPHSFAMAGADPAVQKEAAHIVHSVAEAARWVLDFNRNRQATESGLDEERMQKG
jgi:Cof subfamily protein (haloacid dehalogenase superfamily)